MQALWMVLAAFFFSLMGVCVKLASAYFNSAELVMYRGILGMLFVAVVARYQGVSLKTQYPLMHAWRSLVGVSSLGCWFYALAHLPLPTAITLNYMSSVWIAAFLVGGALLNWRPGQNSPGSSQQGPLVLTVLAGFAGVILMLRPTLDQNQAFAGAIGLLSGIVSAFAYMQVISLSRVGEPETRTVFLFAVGSTIAGMVAVAVTGVSPWNWQGALWLVPLGLFASGGQLCMTRAYSSAKTPRQTLVVANLNYSGIVFGGIFGIVLFNDVLPAIAWIGMAIILVSGVAATILRGRAVPDSPGEEH